MSRQKTVLVVDDEPKILELLKSYLETNGYAALCAKTCGEGMRLFRQNSVSLVLLDLMLPDFSGELLCKNIREESDVPLIMITAKVDEESIIRGLKTGADDYVCKPFSPRQLMARIEAALRRSGGEAKGEGRVLSSGELTVDTGKRQASRNGQALALTRDEYRILELLMSRQTKIFTRDEIIEAVKGEDYGGFDRSVDSAVKRLRAKIGDDPKAPKYISTVYGMGYRFGGLNDT